jgi:hypothetical protein
MGLVEEHFAALKANGSRRLLYADASLTPVGNGTYLVRLQDYSLPSGWKPRHTNIYFLVPAGYPVSRPDTFWTEANVFLESGGQPMNIGTNQQPGVPANLKWFSWHPGTWNANRDSLITWVEMIRRRFEDRR